MTVPYFYKNSNSRFLSIEGEDSNEFLQNLITNDINQCSKDNFLYSCLLTPQGKFLSDFFIFKEDKKCRRIQEKNRSNSKLKKPFISASYREP